MEKRMKIIIITIVSVIALVGASIFIYKALTKDKPEEHEVKYNESSEILKNSEVKGLKIHDISLKVVDGQSNYKAKATNTTEEKIDFVGIVITFYKDEEQMGKIEIYNQRTIEPGETIDLENLTDMDLFKATSSKIEWIGE